MLQSVCNMIPLCTIPAGYMIIPLRPPPPAAMIGGGGHERRPLGPANGVPPSADLCVDALEQQLDGQRAFQQQLLQRMRKLEGCVAEEREGRRSTQADLGAELARIGQLEGCMAEEREARQRTQADLEAELARASELEGCMAEEREARQRTQADLEAELARASELEVSRWFAAGLCVALRGSLKTVGKARASQHVDMSRA